MAKTVCRIGHFLFLLMGTSFLCADWNTDFDTVSQSLIKEVPALQKTRYLDVCEAFCAHRESLFLDSRFLDQIRNSLEEDKLQIVLQKEHLICKKRRENNIKEAFAWEVACLLGGSACVVPSFPIEIEGKRVIVQKKERFIVDAEKTGGGLPLETLQLVSLETYWKANIIAYLLAFKDLIGRNIGINNLGQIRLFDLEYSFLYGKAALQRKETDKVEFACQAFDWPQFEAPLTEGTARSLRSFISSLEEVKNDIRIYASHRDLNFPYEEIIKRIDRVRAFLIKPGVSFLQFYIFLFPKMEEGLPRIRSIASGSLHKRVGYGTALLFACGNCNFSRASSRDQKAVRRWVDTYVK